MHVCLRRSDRFSVCLRVCVCVCVLSVRVSVCLRSCLLSYILVCKYVRIMNACIFKYVFVYASESMIELVWQQLNQSMNQSASPSVRQ